ncbi:PQQ-binding-like beta-propeller repeat protein [Aquimarina litoralis]|uniref:outer membrane protein assembly factor BamB family protein n=1 Tax=Aquimarina litoralis TaxID=584605 RepID=UPI001C58D3DF|nr:PQQ-binding-like beta-propeller repeat protein [Aquimarina litoralis]MBW1294793.1 PQQ-binding-like beta-propeller repeat protein [Aquimarina litoralis]
MKKNISTLVLFKIVISFAQNTPTTVEVTTSKMGVNKIHNSDIIGTAYEFPERIENFYLDTITSTITVQTRGVSKNGKRLNNIGQLMKYDIYNNNLLWSKKFSYNRSTLKQKNQTLLISKQNKTIKIDPDNGKETLKTKNYIYSLIDQKNLALGYRIKASGVSKDELRAIDLKNGDLKWQRKIPNEFGWNEIIHLNDSTIIISSNGLHKINLRTGKGWDYNTVTGKKDYTAPVIANTIAGIAAIFTGTFVASSGPNLVKNLVSNMLIEDSDFYLSSEEQVAKINGETGEIIWKSSFDKNTSSRSHIFIENETLFLLNFGLANTGTRALRFGKPFLAAYNKSTGKKLYQKTFTLEGKKSIITDYKIIEGNLILLSDSKLFLVDKNTGSITKSIKFNSDQNGMLKFFEEDKILILKDLNEKISFENTDKTRSYLLSSKRYVLSINNIDLTKGTRLDINQILIDNGYYEDKRLLSRGAKTYLIDKNNSITSELNMSSKSFIIDNFIIEVNDNKVQIIDLKKSL